ncbi:MAG: hypothetical protein UV74_C0013G0408 [Candidatus Woesebacteria bacterium GW2011_GWB1_43_14]|uniref:Peptidase C39-like domain-containing protein n=1 Tax=Candidatus Woesebacteria bacterium GW2011_GWB1_43_14 TaxID=1618578 RepID=A0A0G1FQH7_9BACT|nr:MAG: hypothetical protein UT21_C0001G0120 [Candidatus Woesebacteria bacterium GW2011_GWA1_39_11b]KKS78295.1 MAG: hypothetical protein UV51_C0001G0011 [Candidatus Woesebacteria bacterium GW2011_GWC1_42_9]KKS97286.1 MAG: hypothetical protein UV74_C0013G0408 [Candidatus Woesebacteria bacterium GW2011_GWB1_43_14]
MKKLLFLIFFCLFLVVLSSGDLSAAEGIAVSGFKYPRNRFALVSITGGLPPSHHYSDILYGKLRNSNNFGVSGVVSCPIKFEPFLLDILPGSLVDSNGNPRIDVFFGGISEDRNLTLTEAHELAKYIQAGGVVYISGMGGMKIIGPEYNLLFEELGINDRLSEIASFPGPGVQSSDPANTTPLTNGPFGVVGSLKHESFRNLQLFSLTGIAIGYNTSEYILAEGQFGKGYLSVTGGPLYINTVFGDNDNQKYFLNLFAMGCKESGEDEVVLNVPSIKQGLDPFYNNVPVWENFIYDSADLQTLGCGTTIAQCGCALTSANMIMAYYGINHGPDGSLINPESVNEYFSKNRQGTGNLYSSWGYSYGNFHWGRVDDYTALANRLYSNQAKLDQPVIENYDFNSLKSYINNNIPVILKVTRADGGIHWVVAKGYVGEDVIINDPVNPDPVSGSKTLADYNYSPHQSNSMVHYIETHSDFSSLEFVAPSSVQLLITGSNGEQTGYKDGLILENIPNSEYFFDESYDTTGNGVNSLNIYTPEKGKYILDVISSNEDCSLTVYSSNINADSEFQINNYLCNKGTKFQYDPSDVISLRQIIDIDARPYKSINLLVSHSKSLVDLAIFSSSVFDATKIDNQSLRLGKTGHEDSLKFCLKSRDLNRDGLLDMRCFFENELLGVGEGDTEIILPGKTIEGVSFVGVSELEVK